MKLKIRTKDIEIEYSDDYSMITGDGKRRIIEILESTFEKQKELNLIKSELVELDMDFEEEDPSRSMRYWQDPNDIFGQDGKPDWTCKYCNDGECNHKCLKGV